MAENNNVVLTNLRHLSKQMEGIGADMNNFMDQQAHGGAPDPSEFQRLLEAQSVTKTAMTAQFNLIQKPLKTVLNETR